MKRKNASVEDFFFFQQDLSGVGKCAKGMIVSICVCVYVYIYIYIYIYTQYVYDIDISHVDRSSSYSVGQYDLTR